jgi:hypothetical protein
VGGIFAVMTAPESDKHRAISLLGLMSKLIAAL